MARGEPWTEQEISLLEEMAESGMNPQQIYDSGKLPGRTLHSIVKQFYGNISIVKQTAKVITIELAQNPLSMERVIRLFSTASEQICGLSVVEQNFHCKFI
jgi:hypothetical protein